MAEFDRSVRLEKFGNYDVKSSLGLEDLTISVGDALSEFGQPLMIGENTYWVDLSDRLNIKYIICEVTDRGDGIYGINLSSGIRPSLMTDVVMGLSAIAGFYLLRKMFDASFVMLSAVTIAVLAAAVLYLTVFQSSRFRNKDCEAVISHFNGIFIKQEQK